MSDHPFSDGLLLKCFFDGSGDRSFCEGESGTGLSDGDYRPCRMVSGDPGFYFCFDGVLGLCDQGILSGDEPTSVLFDVFLISTASSATSL